MANQPRPDNPNRNIRIDDADWEDVAELAAQDRVSKSEIVREAIRQYVRRRKNGDS